MLDGRCWILDLREIKFCVRIFGDKKGKIHGAMWSSHPTTGGDETLFVGVDAHIMPPFQMMFIIKCSI